MVEKPEVIRWCVVHDAQEVADAALGREITMLNACWRRYFWSMSYDNRCDLKEISVEPIMEMERIRIDEETPEGWDEVLVGAEFKMLSRVVGYRRVLPIRDQDMAPREDWGRGLSEALESRE